MGKLSVGVYCPKWKSFYWMREPEEGTLQAEYKSLTKEQYDRYKELYKNNNNKDTPMYFEGEDKLIEYLKETNH